MGIETFGAHTGALEGKPTVWLRGVDMMGRQKGREMNRNKREMGEIRGTQPSLYSAGN
jgi:hypothetical protein